jgi:hypothetical protein
LAGPFANDEGGLFVYNAAGREDALSYFQHDPFAVEGVFADYELLEWIVEGVNPDLLTSDVSPSPSVRHTCCPNAGSAPNNDFNA